MSNEWDRLHVGRPETPMGAIKHAYCCTECGEVFWMCLYATRRMIEEEPAMPCGHIWHNVELRKSLEMPSAVEPGEQI